MPVTMKRLFLGVCWLVICTLPAMGAELTQEQTSAYRLAVEEARAGRTTPALESLRILTAALPDQQDILGDYAVIQGWAGDDAGALRTLERINRSSAPLFVLEGVAASARRVRQFELSQSLYRESIARDADRAEPWIGLALTLTSAGDLDAATAMVTTLTARFPQRTDVLEAAAEVAVAKRDLFNALAAYQAILVQKPADVAALRGKILTLGRIGAPQLAAELADRNPGVLAPHERAALAADSTATRIRWGAIAADAGRGPVRFALLDQALAESVAAGERALDLAVELGAVERQLALDRVVALSARFRMAEAVALYQALAGRVAPVPAYVKNSAAGASLYLENPEFARDLYREALALDPNNLESRLGLFYALAESEEHTAALDQIDQLVAVTPIWIDAWSPATVRENPAYAQVLTTRAVAPLLANQPGEGFGRLNRLSDRAPFNMDIRTSLASSMRARGWPRAAERELRWILAAEPFNGPALGERAGALLEMGDFRAAATGLAAAQAVSAEDKRVTGATRLAKVHEMRELIVDGTVGRSSGGPSGTQDFALESWLYSSPLGSQYRAFAHLYDAQARFANGSGRRERAGVGLEYRSPLMRATGELSQGLNGGSTGAAASLAVTPNDFWTFRGKLDSSANQIPLQAHLAGINARHALAEIVWRADESRRAAVSLQRFAFSDGNRRDVAQARWTERVIAGPVYQLEVTAGLYASKNSLTGAPYFNPSSDLSPTLELANEWLQWRRYTRAFRHRLVVTVGDYRQQGFGSATVAGARYEQEWSADDRLVFRYGIGRSRHPYDGVQTVRDFAYVSLNWRF